MRLERPDGNNSVVTLSDRARLAALAATGLMDQPADPALDRFTRIAARVLGAPVSLLSLVDDRRQFFASAFGLDDPWATRRQTPLTHSFCQHVVVDAEPLVVEDAREHPRLRTNLAIPDLGVVAYAGVPVRSRTGEIVGSFCVIDDEPHAWSDDDIAVLHDLAEAVAAELRLREVAGRAAALVSSLPVVTFDLDLDGQLTSIDGDVESLLGAAPDALLADGCAWIDLIDEADRAAVLATRATSRERERCTIAYRLRPMTGSWLWVQETLRRRVGVDGRPVAVHGAIIDVTPQHQLGQRLEAQNRLSLRLARASSLDEVVGDVLEDLGDSLGWQVGALWLPNARGDRLECLGHWQVEGATKRFGEVTATSTFAAGVGLPGTCWAAGQPVWVEDVTVADNFPRRAAAVADGLHSALAFPILRAGSTAGVVEFFDREMRQPDAGLVEFARSVGSQIGQFLDRVESEQEIRRSRERYRRIARTFQRSLVPAVPPVIDGWRAAVRFNPAHEGEVVGGDFFDVFRQVDGSWAVTIGDVCGKGTGAAAVTSLVRHALRGAALAGASPAAALETANQALLNEQLDERFCTALFVAASTVGDLRHISIASAGHPPPLVRRITGEVELVQTEGLVLGAFPRLDATTASIELRCGELVVLYTDGYTEARCDADQFGIGRLVAAVRDLDAHDADAVATSIDDAVIEFTKGDQRRDDQALVVLEATRAIQ